MEGERGVRGWVRFFVVCGLGWEGKGREEWGVVVVAAAAVCVSSWVVMSF